jgi:hypothetical protein
MEDGADVSRRQVLTAGGLAASAPLLAGGTTSITVTHYGAAAGSATYAPLDTFVLRKPLERGPGRPHEAPRAAAPAEPVR